MNYLFGFLEREIGRSVVLLVDDYDDPIVSAVGTEDEEKTQNMVWNLLSSCTKECDGLEFAIMTGTVRLVDDCFMSGCLNNISVDWMNDVCGKSVMRFSDDDVRKMCEDYGHPEKFDEAKKWYGGYTVGNEDSFDFSGAVEYVYNGFVPRIYRRGGFNKSIEFMLDAMNVDVARRLWELYDGNDTYTRGRTQISFKQLKNPSWLIELLTVNGYLGEKCENDYGSTYIPNESMRLLYEEEIVLRLPERRM